MNASLWSMDAHHAEFFPGGFTDFVPSPDIFGRIFTNVPGVRNHPMLL
jgi:hypothetical protein